MCSKSIFFYLQDGVISDMTRTVDKIVAASQLPLSIVIVGVGGADFTNMVRTLYIKMYVPSIDDGIVY